MPPGVSHEDRIRLTGSRLPAKSQLGLVHLNNSPTLRGDRSLLSTALPPDSQTERRTCYLHVGTHKTGTTTLQSSLAANARQLASAGILFPQAGRWRDNGGHHNIAWELNGDERFDRARGTLADLLAECRASDCRAVCVSSEDFEYLYATPDALTRIADGFAAIGYGVKVIVYLRPQASYAESLYAELVKHGYARRFDQYLATIVRDGSVIFGRNWRFTFDYAALLDGFATAFGADALVVRPYAPAALRATLSDDFLAIVGANAGPIDTRAFRRAGRLNTSLPFIDVMRRYAANVRASSPGDAARGPFETRALRRRFDPIALPEIARIAERFARSNAIVHEKYGITVPFVSRRDLLGDIIATLGFAPGSDTRRRVLLAQAMAEERALSRAGQPELVL